MSEPSALTPIDEISAKKIRGIRRNVRRRLERIELLLAWNGQFGRSDLTEFFKISEQQASADIALYKEIAPNNTYYDPGEKRYEATPDFAQCLVDLSADRFLVQLQALHAGILEPGQTWFSDPPPFDVSPTFVPKVEVSPLREVLTAIREGLALEIRYQPLTRPKASNRWIAPHALAFNRRRWHVRAWCFDRDEFRDFVLTRILEIGGLAHISEDAEIHVTAKQDIDWQTKVAVKITPCSDLEETQRRVIAHDYGMTIRGRSIDIRKALLLYFVDNYRLDLRRYGSIPASERQIEIGNWEEVEPLIPAPKSVD